MSRPDAARRVLVIDDDPANLELVERRLEAADYEVALADCGRDGLALARRERFAAVLLDLRLPDLDGLDVLEALRALEPRLPVIIMTAHGAPALEEEARARGATNYMIKPLGRVAMLDALQAALDEAPPGGP